MEDFKPTFFSTFNYMDIMTLLFNLFILVQAILNKIDIFTVALLFFLEIFISSLFNLPKILSRRYDDEMVVHRAISSFLFIAAWNAAIALFLYKFKPAESFTFLWDNYYLIATLLVFNALSLIFFYASKDSLTSASIRRKYYYGFVKLVIFIFLAYYFSFLMLIPAGILIIITIVKIMTDLTVGRSNYIHD